MNTLCLQIYPRKYGEGSILWCVKINVLLSVSAELTFGGKVIAARETLMATRVHRYQVAIVAIVLLVAAGPLALKFILPSQAYALISSVLVITSRRIKLVILEQ